MSKMMIACAATLALALVHARSAQADVGDWWCPNDAWNWSSRTVIPVWIHPDLAASLQHSTGVLWTNAELQAEVEMVLERMMMQAPSGLPPFKFMGFEDPGTGWMDPAGNGGDTPAPWSVSIRPNQCLRGDHTCDLCCPTCNRCCDATAGGVNDPDGIRIVLGRSAGDCDPEVPGTQPGGSDEHWATDGDKDMIAGVLMHELAHTEGFAHWDASNLPICNDPNIAPACNDNPNQPACCGEMQASGLATCETELEYADWDMVTSKYGAWENDGRYRRETANGATWTTLSAGTLQSGPMMAAGRAPHAMPLVTTDGSTVKPHMWRWQRSSGIFADWGTEASIGPQFGQLAAAYKSLADMVIFYESPQTMTDTRKHGYFTVNISGGGGYNITPTFYIDRHGVQGTFDPKSSYLIHVYRGWENQILLSTSSLLSAPGTPTTPVAITGDANKAAYTPSIACGDASITYNCILVWMTAADYHTGATFRGLRWVQFNYNGSSFTFSNVYQLGYTMYGPPAVTYKGTTSSNGAFVVAFQNPGDCAFSLYKSTTTTNTFHGEVSHCAGSGKHIGPPLLGSINATAYSELWLQYNAEN